LVNRDKKSATSFINEAEGDMITLDVIKYNAKEIANWLNNPVSKRSKEFTLEYGSKIGHGISKEHGYSNDIKKAEIWLRKNNQGGYEVITSYPLYKDK